MPYEVIAKQRAEFKGFRRSGIFFPSDQPTVLSNEEMTPAIRAEPMLIVTKVKAEPKSLEEMSIAELRTFAADSEIEIPKEAKKHAEILAVIQEALAKLEAEKAKAGEEE